MIHDEEDDPEGPEDISGYCQYYTDDYDTDDIKADLAAEYDVSVENVVLYAYTGSRTVPVYDIA